MEKMGRKKLLISSKTYPLVSLRVELCDQVSVCRLVEVGGLNGMSNSYADRSTERDRFYED